MDFQRSIKKEYLKLRGGESEVTHLSVYFFYIFGEGYELEVWPVKKDGAVPQEHKENYVSVPGYLGKCIILVKHSDDDKLDKAHEALARELYPKAKEKLVNEILKKYSLDLELD